MKELFVKNKYFLIPSFIFILIGIIISILINKIDIHLFLNKLYHPNLDFFFLQLTYSFELPIYLILIFFIYFILFKINNLIILIISYLTTSLISFLLKNYVFIDYYRPTHYINNLRLIDANYDYHQNLFNSFPSGHSITAFCIYTLIAINVKNDYLKIVLFILAFLTAYSRIYLSQHFLIDIVFGSLIGILFSFIIHYYYKNKIKVD